MHLHTYLNYGGNCAEAFKFYEQNLGGKITMMMRHGEAPDQSQVRPEWKHAVLHARITIGDAEISAADVPPDRFQPMRSAYLSLSVDTIQDAERIYALLSDGGQIFISIDEGLLLLVLEAVLANVGPELFGQLRARQGFVAHDSSEFGVRLDGFHECCVRFALSSFLRSHPCF